MTGNLDFYPCKYDRAFKEVFLDPINKDLLKALLETVLKVEIDDIILNKTELLSGNIKVKDKRVDAIIRTGNKIINIEINSNLRNYFPSRNASYVFNIYQSKYLIGDKYIEDEDIIQINFLWDLGVDRININRFKLLSLNVPLTCYIQNFIIYEIILYLKLLAYQLKK